MQKSLSGGGSTIGTYNNAAILAGFKNNPALNAFLSSDRGRYFVDTQTGAFVGTFLRGVAEAIGNTTAGMAILSDPAMFSLVMQA